MANCSMCKCKEIIKKGEVGVEFSFPYGVSVVLIEEYDEDFNDQECDYFES